VARGIRWWTFALGAALAIAACDDPGVTLEGAAPADSGRDGRDAGGVGGSGKPSPSGGAAGTATGGLESSNAAGSSGTAATARGGSGSVPENPRAGSGGVQQDPPGGTGGALGGSSSSGDAGDDAGSLPEAGSGGEGGGSGECERTHRIAKGEWEVYRTADELEALRGVGTIVGQFMISSEETIVDLSMLHCLREIRGDIYVDARFWLQTLDGLQNLHHVSGAAVFMFLNDLRGLEGLTTVRHLSLHKVGDASALSSLQRVDGGLNISQMWATNLDGLQNVTSAGKISIRMNPELTNVDGLRSIASAESLEIDGNIRLENLDGLSALTHVAGDVTIADFCTRTATPECHYQDQLTSLYGLRSLQSIGGNLKVANNRMLPTCEAEWLRDSVGSANIEGTVTIAGNDDAGSCEPR
jgi:hypothetical protein